MNNVIFYEDDLFRYFWKPRGIPTTFGKEKSFLEILFNDKTFKGKSKIETEIISSIIEFLSDIFGYEQEYGLLNRLDNDTGGLLYFAKNPFVYNLYKEKQIEGYIEKKYIADVYGRLNEKLFEINNPIAHHKFNDQKMIVVRDIDKDKNKIRGKLHNVISFVEELYYDEKNNVSVLSITIKKGIRHQIRAHLASIGYPIIGDILYNKGYLNNKLHLWSVGLKIN